MRKIFSQRWIIADCYYNHYWGSVSYVCCLECAISVSWPLGRSLQVFLHHPWMTWVLIYLNEPEIQDEFTLIGPWLEKKVFVKPWHRPFFQSVDLYVLRRTLILVKGQTSLDIDRHATWDWLLGRANAAQIWGRWGTVLGCMCYGQVCCTWMICLAVDIPILDRDWN